MGRVRSGGDLPRREPVPSLKDYRPGEDKRDPCNPVSKLLTMGSKSAVPKIRTGHFAISSPRWDSPVGHFLGWRGIYHTHPLSFSTNCEPYSKPPIVFFKCDLVGKTSTLTSRIVSPEEGRARLEPETPFFPEA